MRIAVLSDIHGNLPALEAVLRDIHRRGVDQIVNLGDSLSGPLLPRETAQLLMAQTWPQLAGNHERQLLEQPPEQMGPSDAFAHAQLGPAEFRWLARLPPRLWLEPDVLLCHGTPDSDLHYWLETVVSPGLRPASAEEVLTRQGALHASLALCGHSHVPRSMRSSSGCLIVNPGSVGLQAYVTDWPQAHAVENGSPDARYAVVERGADGWSANLISLPYDHRQMARLARSNERPDWARALACGYVR